MTVGQHALVFVDSSIRDYATLARSISSAAELIVFDGTKDGVAQISTALAARTGVSAVHIISHGADGVLQLGATSLSTDTLPAHADAISGWSAALASGADILLYGCNVAQGPIGHAFVQRIASLTSANVAASTDTTGAAALGGNWALEYATGPIAADPVIPADVAYDGVLSVELGATLHWAVNLTDPGGPGTVTIDFTLDAEFRADYPWGSQGFVVGGSPTDTVANGGIHVGTILEGPGGIDDLSFGDGTGLGDEFLNTTRPYFEVTSINTAEDTLTAVMVTRTGAPITHTYSSTTANYVVTWDGELRESFTSDAFHDQPWRSETIVDIAPGVTKSPVITSPLEFFVTDNTVAQVQPEAAVFDNDIGVWRLGTAAEFIGDQTATGFPLQFPPGSTVAPPGLTINSSSGLITWDLLDADNPTVAPGDSYVVTAMLESVNPSTMAVDSETPFDFLIRVTSNPTPPPPIFDSVPPDSTVFFGAPQDFVITAHDPDGDPITITTGTLPTGMTSVFDPATNELHLHFDPTAAEIGQSFVVGFEAIDNNSGAPSSPQFVTFTVGAPPAITVLVGQPVNGSAIEVQGTGENGYTVTLYADGGSTAVGSGLVSGGTFDITTNSTFTDGNHTLTAIETDASGLTSPASASFPVAVDPTAPAITVLVGQPVNGSAVEVQGTGENGETVTLYADGGSTAVGSGLVSGGAFDITTTETFAAGPHTLSATETDSASLTSSASESFDLVVGNVWVGPPSKVAGSIRSGVWNTPADWNGGVPGVGDLAILEPSATAYTVTSKISTEIGTLDLNPISGSVNNAGTIKVLDGSALVLRGNVEGGGAISITDAGSVVDLAGASIDGSGTLRMAAGTEVEANGGPSSSSTIGAVTVTDKGTLLATNHTTLTLLGTTVNATITTSGGTITGGIIEASDGLAAPATIALSGATINRAALETAADGVIETVFGTDSTLNGVTVTAGSTVTVADGSTLTLAKGTTTNDGTIALISSGDATVLALAGNVTLTGGGDVMLGSPTGDAILAGGATSETPFVLTDVDNTVAGAGAIGNGDATLRLSLQAAATVDADGPTTLTIDTGNTVTNAGLLEATGAGGLTITDAVVNNNTIVADGGNVTITGNLTGTGASEIFSDSQLELQGNLNKGAVSFENNAGGTGMLVLDNASEFRGTVAGLYSDGTNSDALDLQNIDFASGVTWKFTEDVGGQQGVLSVRDHSGDVANITLLGQYLASGGVASSTGAHPSTIFQTAADLTGGTLITSNVHAPVVAV